MKPPDCPRESSTGVVSPKSGVVFPGWPGHSDVRAAQPQAASGKGVRPNLLGNVLVLVALGMALSVKSAGAQPEAPEPTVLTIRPAGEPVPALKYRLVPESRELVPGNAAVFYHRAILLLQQSRQAESTAQPRPPQQERPENRISEWVSGPLDEIPRDEARTLLERYRNVLNEVDLGVQRRECDWEFATRPETIELLLPEIQEMRSLARLVALKVRVALLDGDTDEAWHWLRIGYTMGRHVSQGPDLIQGLVGVAISGVMSRHLEELIQASGTPSLYWAIASRPQPVIDMTPGLEGQRVIFERMLPGLEELNDGPWSVARGRKFADELLRLFRMAGIPILGPEEAGTGPPPLRGWVGRLALAGLVARDYPAAKLALIDSGHSAAEVEVMPTIQVVGLNAYMEYQRVRDDVYKWIYLPHWQSHAQALAALQRAELSDPGEKADSPLITLFLTLVPANDHIRITEVRAERQLAALQCVEAIRLYAAAHDGALPPNLDAITDAPAPLDPATGRPFEYKTLADQAILSAPLIPGAPDHPAYMLRYELKLVR